MHASTWPRLAELRSPAHGRARRRWHSWLNLKEAAAWLSLPANAFMRLVNRGMLPKAVVDPYGRKVWWPPELRLAAQDLPVRLTPFGRSRREDVA